MFPSLFKTSTIPVLEQMLSFTQARHGVLAGNIANLDTPGYRVRDLSPEAFQEQLREAIAADEQPTITGSPGETAALSAGSIDEVASTPDAFLYHDDSTGNLENQVSQIAKNQMQHNVALAILTSQFRLLQTAISERA